MAEENPYQLQVDVSGSNRLRLHWDMTAGTYLYQEKLKVALEQTAAASLGEIQLPPAFIKKDAFRPDGTTGDVAVYYRSLDLSIPLLRSTETTADITLIVSYQGCSDEGICYPPVKQQVKISLPAAGGVASIVPTAPPLSEQDQIAETLAGGDLWGILVLFFGAGILLAFTPCIFPTIPILSGIIVGHGAELDPRKGFLLSLLYVTAMASTYAAAGVVAGLFGRNLQVDMQNPWMLSAFALLFVLLALSMFGLYKIQLPSSWQSSLTVLSNRQKGGSWAGVAIMGALSALIVGPCVAPPFAGALIYVAKTGDALLGGAAFFTLGIGMGAPLLLIGASAGKLLPKAGHWMETINSLFGILFLAVAILLLERILPAEISTLLWGLLLLGTAVYLWAPHGLPTHRRGLKYLRRGMGLALLIYGGLILFSNPQPHLQFRSVKGMEQLQLEVAAARAKGRPVMLDFYADWCISCKELERYTFSDPGVVSALGGFVLLQADVTANDESDRIMLNQFEISGPPLIVFYGPDGVEQRHLRLVGYIAPPEFIAHVAKIGQE